MDRVTNMIKVRLRVERVTNWLWYSDMRGVRAQAGLGGDRKGRLVHALGASTRAP